jgi:hypothetical protein
MVSELISRTKLDTEVNGMSYTWSGPMLPEWRPRYSMYVLIRPPKSRQSDPRNNHIAVLLLDKPVVVWRTSSAS